MEIIVQWLDDLDDLIFAFVQTVERMRLPSLTIGFGAACVLLTDRLAALPPRWALALVAVALGGLCLWALGSVIRGLPPSWLPRSTADSRPTA